MTQAYAQQNRGKTYPFTTTPRPNSPGVVNLEMKFERSGVPLDVQIPVPVSVESAPGAHPSPSELMTIARRVLAAARASAESARSK